VLLIRLNRKEDVDLAQLPLDRLPFRELWFLWQSSADGAQWSILGDALGHPIRYDFFYPGPDDIEGPFNAMEN
jgi:hypothetical protein